MRITQEELFSIEGIPLAQEDQDRILRLITRLRDATADNRIIVFDWQDVSEEIRSVFNWAGGDEDWFVVMAKEPEWLPRWLEVMDSMESPDVYILDGVVVYVAGHA